MKEYIIYLVVEFCGILIIIFPKLEIGVRLCTFVIVTFINLIAVIITLIIKNKKITAKNLKLSKDIENLENIKKDISLQAETQKSEIQSYIGLISEMGKKIEVDNGKYLKIAFKEISEIYHAFKIRKGLDK